MALSEGITKFESPIETSTPPDLPNQWEGISPPMTQRRPPMHKHPPTCKTEKPHLTESLHDALIRLKRIYNFLCSMLVYTRFALSFVTLRGIFMHFLQLTY
jgi:hypothetical protein